MNIELRLKTLEKKINPPTTGIKSSDERFNKYFKSGVRVYHGERAWQKEKEEIGKNIAQDFNMSIEEATTIVNERHKQGIHVFSE